MTNKIKSFLAITAAILLLMPITVLATHSENKFFRGEIKEKSEIAGEDLAKWIWGNRERFYSYVFDERGNRVQLKSIDFQRFFDLLNNVEANQFIIIRSKPTFAHHSRLSQAAPKPSAEITNIYASYIQKKFIEKPGFTSFLGNKKEYPTTTLTDSQLDKLIKTCKTVFHSVARKNIVTTSVPRDDLKNLVFNPSARSNNACINNVLKDFGL